MKKVLFLTAVLALASCKKEQEPFGKSTETTTETYSEGESAEVKTPEALGKSILKEKGIVFPAIRLIKKLLVRVFRKSGKFTKTKKAIL